MVAFGEHLSTHQQAGLAALNLFEHLLEALFFARAVAVNAVNGGVREQPLECLLGTLRAATQRTQVAAAAVWAGIRQGAAAVAVVAGQQRWLAV